MQERGPAAYVAEFIGTLFLVFLITATVSLYPPVGTPAPTAIDPAATVVFQEVAVLGLVHVFVLFALIQTLAVISGAHFNPAVTVAMTAIRRIDPRDAGIYIVCQLAGGVAGALLTKGFFLDDGDPVHYGATLVSGRIDGQIFPGMAAEAIGTFLLVWVIVGVLVSPRGLKDWGGLAVGATLGLLVMVFAPLTGASFNPARSFGPALVGKEFGGFDDFVLVYVLAPVIGGLVAAVAYFTLFIKNGPGGTEPAG